MNNYQHTLFPYAYNILGSVEDAKDVIQDVMVKYLSIPKDHVANELPYLVRSVINQSINTKKSKSKTVYSSAWLPEPIATEKADGNLVKREIIGYSMLVLLEKLNPKERAVFILKEAFDYPHEDIAETLGITIENSRKLLSRARINLGASGVVKEVPIDASVFLNNYIEVIKNGDVKTLEKLLATDIAATSDGGPRVKGVSEFTQGIETVAQAILAVQQKFLQKLTVTQTIVNHQPALLYYKGKRASVCVVFDVDSTTGKINSMYSIIDPKKLKGFILS